MKDTDLTHLLRTWPHEPGRVNARQIIAADGRALLQVRVDLGVLQMEVLGRPDGLKPDGHESLLAQHRDRLKRYETETGSQTGFVLSVEECRALRDEALQHYHRYVGFFALGDFAGVLRDVQHNLEVFDLCRDFGPTDGDRSVLEQFRPPVLMMRVRSEAELALATGDPKQAIRSLDRGLEELRTVLEDAGRGEEYDHANEVQLLRGMRDALVPKLPASQRAELQERLRAALDAENYELAAILRDELRMLDD